ncbi:soluble quino protein glucose/sorbosone dehydrogenase [Clohesyomyces aquaticus]|uniref:Soluble quino protein glucose/sorbosone dehydrogenase n=1 Tax=Clohesyomyces aquaticus TaxID=1231657 RepID=A0A1Y1ZR87_9PLEO|nr:soluble quino protein glucose/sorbosone dehydrogenase [Clohesyomyces aquaticus]
MAALVPQTLAQTCATINPAWQPTFAPGYSGRVVMNGLQYPRSLIFDCNGNMLTTEGGGYGVRYIQLTDNGGTDVCVKSSKQLIKDSSINHGIALTPDCKTLFVSSLTTVWSWTYDGTNGTVSNKKTVVQNMKNGGYHLSRTLLVPKANPDMLIIQRGSDGNLDAAAAQVETARSQLRVFKIADIQAAAVDYTKGEVLAMGLRNTVGVGESPKGGIWTVDNGCDDMTRGGKDIHQENPCEELNYHGIINDTAAAEHGKDYGYPDCYAVWEPSIIPDNANLKVGTPFVIDNATAANTDATCQAKMAPKLCFPSHTAPLDIKFNAKGDIGYIPFHGSWDKAKPDGFRLSKVAFDPATGMPVEPSTSTTAAVNVMWNADNSQCPNKCFRPVTLAWGPKGQLFMTCDETNEIWVIGVRRLLEWKGHGYRGLLRYWIVCV